MGLCSGFVLKTVLIIQGCFRYCWAALTQSQGLFCSPPHQRAGWGCTRSWEGTQPGQLTPTAQRDIPYHRTPCSAYKAGGRRRKGGTLGVMAFCLPKQLLHAMEPCFPRGGWTPACRWEAANEFLALLCLCAQLLLYLNCLYLNLRVFSLLLFWSSPPSHWGGVNERLRGA